MINDDNRISLEQSCYNEFVIADFEQFQIAIASDITVISREIFSVQVPLPKRYYSTSGILIWKGQPKFNLSGLTLKNLYPDESPFPSLKRLSTGQPISFEVKSYEPLPQEVTELAILKCQMIGNETPYHTVFKDIAPRFVQIVPNQGILQLSQQVCHCLQREKCLIQNNWKQLKKTDFYFQAFSKPTQP